MVTDETLELCASKVTDVLTLQAGPRRQQLHSPECDVEEREAGAARGYTQKACVADEGKRSSETRVNMERMSKHRCVNRSKCAGGTDMLSVCSRGLQPTRRKMPMSVSATQ